MGDESTNEPLDLDTFGQRIKERYPDSDYGKLDNATLAQRVLEKYPVYHLSVASPLNRFITDQANAVGIDPKLALGLVYQESRFNPRARSPKGAQGLMQLMPDTAARFGVKDSSDPAQGVPAGLRYLKMHLDEFGDPGKALAAYNAGEGAVRKYKGIPPYAETQNYVKTILGLLDDTGDTGSQPVEFWGKTFDVPDQPEQQQAASTVPKPPVSLSSNDAAWHFGMNPDEAKRLAKNPKALQVLENAVAEDRRKKASGQAIQPPSLSYQNEMRAKAGLRSLRFNAPAANAGKDMADDTAPYYLPTSGTFTKIPVRDVTRPFSMSRNLQGPSQADAIRQQILAEHRQAEQTVANTQEGAGTHLPELTAAEVDAEVERRLQESKYFEAGRADYSQSGIAENLPLELRDLGFQPLANVAAGTNRSIANLIAIPKAVSQAWDFMLDTSGVRPGSNTAEELWGGLQANLRQKAGHLEGMSAQDRQQLEQSGQGSLVHDVKAGAATMVLDLGTKFMMAGALLGGTAGAIAARAGAAPEAIAAASAAAQHPANVMALVNGIDRADKGVIQTALGLAEGYGQGRLLTATETLSKPLSAAIQGTGAAGIALATGGSTRQAAAQAVLQGAGGFLTGGQKAKRNLNEIVRAYRELEKPTESTVPVRPGETPTVQARYQEPGNPRFASLNDSQLQDLIGTLQDRPPKGTSKAARGERPAILSAARDEQLFRQRQGSTVPESPYGGSEVPESDIPSFKDFVEQHPQGGVRFETLTPDDPLFQQRAREYQEQYGTKVDATAAPGPVSPPTVKPAPEANVTPEVPVAPNPTTNEGGNDATQPDLTPVNQRETQATTITGTKVGLRYNAVPADSVRTSFDAGYDPALQPRGTDRAASKARIAQTAAKLDPLQMAESNLASDGAPIVGPDGMVETRNHGTEAVRLAYRNKNEASKAYKQWLTDNAERFGLTKEQVAAIDNPILVRERTTPLADTERVRFAQDANERSTATMSASEQAVIDSQRLDDVIMGHFQPDSTGDLTSAANRNFLRAFLDKIVPSSEQGALQTSDGQIAQAGINRVRNAIFARAYGDIPQGIDILQKLAESTDSNIRNIANAMVAKAGAFMKLQDGIDQGIRHDLNIAPELTQAAGKLSDLKKTGTHVDKYLNQATLGDRELSPEAERLLKVLDDNKRSAKAIGEIVDNYLRAVDAAGNPGQTDLFGGTIVPTKAELIEAAIREAQNAKTQESGLFTEGPTSVDSTVPTRVQPGSAGNPDSAAVDQTFESPRAGVAGSTVPRRDSATQGQLGADESAAFEGDSLDSTVPRNNQSGAVDVDLLTLGVRHFIGQDLVPGAKAGIAGVRDIADSVQALIAPPSRGEFAKVMSRIVRANAADMARVFDIAERSLQGARDHLARLPQSDKYDIIHRIETKQKQKTPELQNFADLMRDMLDARRDRVQALGTGKLNSFIENYFPHIWEDPGKARDVFAALAGKRPIEGSKAFLKERTLPLTRDGLDRGLVPVSDNPVDLTLLKIREMDRYIMAHEVLAETDATGILRLVEHGGMLPPGYAYVDDRIGSPTGRYALPEPAARVLNNYLSPGVNATFLRTPYKVWRWTGNLLNQAQLGISFFHAGMTTLDAAVSRTAVGIEDIVKHGEVGRGLKTIASTVPSPVTNLIQGNKMLKEWYAPGTQGAEIASLVNAAVEAGGRARMDSFYRNNAVQAMTDAFKQGNIIGGTLRAPFAGIEALSHPVMEWLVPRQKMGVFAELARREMEALGPNAPREQVRDALAKAWDSVDNRMGQVVYDNLFWNKVTKDLAMASTRSVGWNIGTVRELGGGLRDFGIAARDLTIGKPVAEVLTPSGKKITTRERGFDFTHRMAYTMALPIVVGMLGATTQYLLTGEPPKDWKDLYAPRTGKVDERGAPERIFYPSYMKDVIAFASEPVRTVLNKAHPLVGLVGEMLSNRDYYGTEIRNSEDSIPQQVLDTMKHFGKGFVPFSVRGYQKETEREASPAMRALPFVGIVPAPASINASPADELMNEITAKHRPQGANTQEEAARYQLLHDLESKLRKGQDIGDELQQGIDNGTLKPGDYLRTQKAAQRAVKQIRFNTLGVEDALDVYEKMSPEERANVEEIMYRKAALISRLPIPKQEATYERFLRLGIGQSTVPTMPQSTVPQ